MDWKNPEEVKAYKRDYYQKHKEEEREKRKAYYIAHRDEQLAYHKAHRARTNKLRRKRDRRIKLEVLEHYSIGLYPICAHCGNEDTDVLEIDHINNDGAEHRKIAGTGSSLYAWLRRNGFPEGFQVLCANCNLKKEILRKRRKYEPD